MTAANNRATLVPAPTHLPPVPLSLAASPPIAFVIDRAHRALNAKDFANADRLYSQALTLDPECVDALYNRGQARHRLGDYPGAADDFRKVLHYSPHNAKVWFKYAAALHMMAETLPALACVEKSLDLDPLDPEAHHVRAGVLHHLNRDEEAEAEWGIAHQLDPNRVETATSAAMTLLRKDQGRNQRGWELFETRRSTGITDLYPGMPLWLNRPGQAIAGQTILVRAEQGYGDTIQFLRYLTPLLEAGAIVHLETPRALARLIAATWPAANIFHRENGVAIPQCDWQTSLMSLPLAFPDYAIGHTYLTLDAEDWYAAAVVSGKVGFVSNGGPRPEDPEANAVDKRRSLTPEATRVLRDELELRVKVVSLQLEDLPPDAKDFYDTARIILGLDLVITVDTAVAHLAGALGVPVWVLNRYDSCWRWGNAGDTTHWYTSMRLFRQPTAGDWETVTRRVLQALDARQ